MKLSATRIQCYLTCPRKYRYRYVDEIPTVPIAASALGKALHQALHRFHETELTTGQLPRAEALLADFDVAWRELVASERPAFNAGDSVTSLETLGHKLLTSYFQSESQEVASGSPRPMALEFTFEMPWPSKSGKEEHRLTGIIDRVDQGSSGLIVIDYKSGKSKPTPQQLDCDLQLTLYTLAAEHLFGSPVERVVCRPLRGRVALSTVIGDSQKSWVRDQIVPYMTEAVSHGTFTPHRGYWCRYCDYRELCALESEAEIPGYDSFAAAEADELLAACEPDT